MKLRVPKLRYVKNVVIIALLVIFFPIGLPLMWKFADWSKKTKYITTGIVAAVVFIGLVGMYYSPPNITIANAKDSRINTDDAEYTLSGDVSGFSAVLLTINDKSVVLTESSEFSHKVTLEEGDNSFNVVASNKNGETKEVITIHRTTQAEFTARTAAESLEAEERTQEENKKVAEAEAKAKEKAEQEAEAKAAADKKTQKDSNKKSRFSWHWPFGKSDETKAKEKAEQDKIAQEKIEATIKARTATIDRFAPIYCEKRQAVKVKLTTSGSADGWPSHDAYGWTKEECMTIVSKLYDSGASEAELELVANGNYAIGMLEMSLLYSLGSPGRLNRTHTSGYTSSQYVYGDPLRNATYIYTVNGMVTAVQN